MVDRCAHSPQHKKEQEAVSEESEHLPRLLPQLWLLCLHTPQGHLNNVNWAKRISEPMFDFPMFPEIDYWILAGDWGTSSSLPIHRWT